MENPGFKVSSVFFILYIYRMKKIMKEKNQVVPDEVLSKEPNIGKMLEGKMDAHLFPFHVTVTANLSR